MKKKYTSPNEYYIKKEDIKSLPYILGIINLIFSFAALFFSFASYYIGLILSIAAAVFSSLLIKKSRQSALIALSVSILSIIISLFIFLVNNFVYL